jgi:hypothetical protein
MNPLKIAQSSYRYILALFIAVLLAACGGSSGGGGSTPAAISATANTTAQSLTVGTAMTSFSPLIASGGATPYTYSYTGTLPAGLSFDASTGAVTGTPTAVYATASLVFSVKDVNNAVASTTSSVSFTVVAAPVSLSATATTTAQNLTVGVAMTGFSPLTASGGTTPYTYSYTGTLPAGLSFSASTGVVSGTPTAVYATASLVFSVKDAINAVASTTSSVSFTVASALNDTGQTQCDNGSNVMVACTPATKGNASGTMPRQDAGFGRDASATAGTLTKIGAGAAGFDYTRVCMSGALAGTGACAASPAAAVDQAAPTANEWACTKDNVTKLVWSLESGSGNWTDYATAAYPTAVNATTRCGFNTGWRLPTRRELLSLVHNGTSNPAIDTAYFPGTVATYYWSNDTYAPNPAGAWVVDFYDGGTGASVKTVNYSVRLVRSGQ